MEFFEKVNELAKAAADKTAEVVEDTRLKAQILNDEKSIRELETKIGAWYYEQFAAGFPVAEEVSEWCTAISVHKANNEEKKEALKHTPAKDAADADDVAEPEEDPFELFYVYVKQGAAAHAASPFSTILFHHNIRKFCICRFPKILRL